MSGRRVLVTGAGGFVGANLVRRLVADGHRVTAIRRPGGTSWRLADLERDLEVVEADLCDGAGLAATVARAAPDWVFHLAAHGAYSWQRDRTQIVATNVVATTTLLDACAASGYEAFVHTGSSSEYGACDHAPAETELPAPDSDYAATKAAATLFCRHVAIDEDRPVLTLRLYSVFGPWEEPDRLLPTLLGHALRGDLPPLVAAETARDFVYVDDAVDALVLAAERAGSVSRGAVLNLGTGVQTSLGGLVASVRRIFDVHTEPVWGTYPSRDWDKTVWRADARLIAAELGWAPAHTLDDGLRAMAAWLADAGGHRTRYALTDG